MIVSAAANNAFAGSVPPELTAYLKTHRDTLYPDLRALWDENGDKTSGTWAEVFGDTARADEIFMAWHYARFIQAVTARGKAAYDIPMYVNTWLMGDNQPPGNYPSGCPEPRVIDIWRAAGHAIDFYAPDLYAPEFEEWCRRFHRDGNPLFMPEARGGALGAANVFYALGEEAGFGFSPFGIEDEADGKSELTASYEVIESFAPLLAERQSAAAVHGFVLDKSHSEVDFTMNGYQLHVTLDDIFGHRSPRGFGLIMSTGPEEFIGAGKGFRVTFSPRSANGPRVGIAAVEEGRFENGKWIAGRRLNGDEDDQGKAWQFDTLILDEKDPANAWYSDNLPARVEKVTLYRFE